MWSPRLWADLLDAQKTNLWVLFYAGCCFTRGAVLGVARVAQGFDGIPQAGKDQEELLNPGDFKQVKYPLIDAGKSDPAARLVA